MKHSEKEDTFVAILNNETLMTIISNANTKEEMQKIFAENGLELTMEEIDAFIMAMNSNTTDELKEEALEGVSGGASGVTAVWIIEKTIQGITAVAKGCWNAGRWLAKQGF